MSRGFACPTCGAPNAFQSSISILAICAYCRSTILRKDLHVENLGQMAELQTDGSPFQLGVQGWYQSVHFTTVGRIQLRYSHGLWNEWHLWFDDAKSGWLGEAQGTLAVSFATPVTEPIPAFDALQPGQALTLKGRTYKVTDSERGTCVAGEGELPFVIGGGYEAPVADLTGPDALFATLDYSEDPPLVFLGAYVDFDTLRLSGLRQIDGW
ncbi:MAG: DUF4178 domain-containing protein [Acidobacteriota bacterium]